MTSDFYILDAIGEPLAIDNVLAWSAWYSTTDRQLADTFIGDTRVSTIFLGVNHNFNDDGPPLLWETLVFGGPLNGEMYRYHTRQEAHAGHDAMCERVRNESR